jgi:hypothetical protein
MQQTSRNSATELHRLAAALACSSVCAVSAYLAASPASAHCFVGARFFPATLATDDPCVADEMSLPTVAVFNTGDVPSVRETDVTVDLAKRITENFGISVARTWTQLSPPGGPDTSGFQNLETAFQYQLLRDAPSELAILAGVVVEWGGTGSAAVGAERFSRITPTLDFGKGFGDLPDSAGWIRAFAVTGQAGLSLPTSLSTTAVDPDTGLSSTTPNPELLVYGGTLQYSMPYLKSNVVDLQLPDFVNHLIPIVEAQFTTPVANNAGLPPVTTGTLNPGVIWVGTYFQVGLEAMIPINRASGTGVGALAQLHLYLDDIFPNTIGKPLFGTAAPPQKPFP